MTCYIYSSGFSIADSIQLNNTNHVTQSRKKHKAKDHRTDGGRNCIVIPRNSNTFFDWRRTCHASLVKTSPSTGSREDKTHCRFPLGPFIKCLLTVTSIIFNYFNGLKTLAKLTRMMRLLETKTTSYLQ